jgi:hypothetical protein
MPIVCSSMGASSIFYSRPVGSVKAADHPISNAWPEVRFWDVMSDLLKANSRTYFEERRKGEGSTYFAVP